MAMEVATEIQRQLGPMAFRMVGASKLVGGDNFLKFKIGSGAKNAINMIEIRLAGDDTYTINFWSFNMRRKDTNDWNRLVRNIEGVYVDMLHDVIERETGMYLSLHARN